MKKILESVGEEISISINNAFLKVPGGQTLLSLTARFREEYEAPIVAARYNNEVVDLYREVTEPGQIEIIDITTEEGLRIYRQSVVYLMSWAAYEIFPLYRISVKHSLNRNYYCEIEGQKKPSPLELAALEAKMKELVAADEPIIPQNLNKKTALKMLTALGYNETVSLLKNIPRESIRIYQSGSFSNYLYSVLVPSTGSLGVFQIQPYAQGFLVRFPSAEDPSRVAPYPNLPKLGQIFRESEEWARILEIHNLAGLYRLLDEKSEELNNLIHVAEALQEKRIAQIADEIYARRDKLRVILIAGPSSSGKTTFAQRLSTQLRVLGLQPIAVSTDDYFVDRELTPRDEQGNYDFEALEAVDVTLFNQHLQQLIECDEVECPVFNFQSGAREMIGRKIQGKEGHPIIIEGIHALNERLTPAIPRENKYKIYISALTQTSIDNHNRISTTDSRLIRRIVRDSQYRSQSALATLKRWNSVRNGEEKNIFPFQEEADIMFNSALVYELGVFRKYAVPLLQAVKREEREYADAQRLLCLLGHFPDIPDKNVPLNSILREFIGGSSIHGN